MKITQIAIVHIEWLFRQWKYIQFVGLDIYTTQEEKKKKRTFLYDNVFDQITRILLYNLG